MSLARILKQRLELLAEAEDELFESIEKSERAIYRAILQVLQRFTKEGKLDPEMDDTELFAALARALDEVIDESTYASKVQKFLPSFDEIDDLSLELYQEILPVAINRLPISVEKKQMVQDIITKLLGAQSIKDNLRRPLQRILFRQITYGADFETAKGILFDFIVSDPERNGYILRYVKQIARDAISQYIGLTNQKIAEEYEEYLDGFIYLGSIIKTSRQNCVDLVSPMVTLDGFPVPTGRFSDLRVGPATYRIADIPEIISRAEGRPGWIPGTSPANFFQNRAGYNCRHDALPVSLDSQAVADLQRQVQPKGPLTYEELQTFKNAGYDTEKIYRPEGKWDPERLQLHEEIREKLQGGVTPEENKVAYMMGGAPANGKSSVIKAGFVDIPENLVEIDSDGIKQLLPEYQLMVENNDRAAAAFAHEESSYLSKQISWNSRDKGLNFLLDGTGDGTYEKLVGKVEKMRAKGHRVVANYVSLDTDLSLKIAKIRAEATGREVPEEYIKYVNSQIPVVIEKGIEDKLWDELYLYDTNVKDKPRLILKMIDGVLDMEDAELYENFLKKKANQ